MGFVDYIQNTRVNRESPENFWDVGGLLKAYNGILSFLITRYPNSTWLRRLMAVGFHLTEAISPSHPYSLFSCPPPNVT